MQSFLVQALLIALCVIHAECGGSRTPCAFSSRSSKSKRHMEPVYRSRRATCDSSDTYRTADGTCNNVDNSEWGAAGAQLARWLEPVYVDATGNPRALATDGSDLPNPRSISNHVHFELSFLSVRNSVMLMQWGQFIDHDITGTPVVTDNGSDIECCDRTDSVPSDTDSPCFPITLPDGDFYFGDGKCMNLVRSEAVSGTGTDSSNPRQQYNELSAFIDGSHIYGISDSETAELRDTDSGSGLLKVGTNNLLPEGDSDDCFLDTSDSSNYCFKAGDSRVNVFPGLSALHTLFMREHNRVATELKGYNSGWDDEKLFQEARRIVIAELQVITYNEWLPQILSDDGVANYSLELGNYNYNSSLDPTLSNVFSTAAFRFGHSMVPENLTIGSEVVDTGDLFKRTKYVINSLDDVISSFLGAAGERVDAWYVDGMRQRMFEEDSDTRDGFDIVSLNIQRGREHGLPPYNAWREYCGLDKITSFTSDNDFGIIQGRDLEDIYNSVDDIDLYSGGVAEVPFDVAAVGRTYICLIGEQFKKLRDGDRFWFESTDSVTGFTSDQITQLKKASLARIICDNADNVSTIQRSAFLNTNIGTNGSGNPEVSCSTLKEVRLRRWQE
ncbi:peroxidasin-like [Haliotis rufescens]|uniref:peroxidasin-like n=1 Tax=Haliotis rufescens TaxID=6454 RepID=UPI00201F1D2D|nr:peroxidasin-like [Haliotis rufescens]